VKLGIDLGGSKIRLAVVHDGIIESKVIDYPGNPTSSKDIKDRLFDAVKSLEKEHFELISVSMAGGLQEGFRNIVKDALKHYSQNIFIFPDIKVVHFSFFEEGDGVVVISGTGSSIYGKKGKAELFYGGLGFAISDVGSGFDIGRNYLSKGLSQMQLGNHKKEAKNIIKYFSQSNVNAIIETIYEGNVVKNIADFSVFVLKNDPLNGIVRSSSSKLAKETLKVIENLDFETVNVGLAGGVFENSKVFSEVFLGVLSKRVKVNVVKRKTSNEIASILMAEKGIKNV
jgi:N-acetylglucosamine kinase-like BadF-type ATPase